MANEYGELDLAGMMSFLPGSTIEALGIALERQRSLRQEKMFAST